MLIMKVKIMPDSPQTDLNKIKTEATKIFDSMGGKLHKSEEEPIAFGLKALIITATWPEDKGSAELEEKLSKIKDVNSAEIVYVTIG